MRTKTRPAPLASIAIALASSTLLLASCGIGTIGAALGLSSDGNNQEPEPPIELLRGDSSPRLLLAEPLEPAEFGIQQGAVVANPTSTIVLRFSQDINQVSAANATYLVEIRRPGSGQDYESVAMSGTIGIGTRTVALGLQQDSILSSKYRVTVGGVQAASGLSTLSTTTSYFVVRGGVFSPVEFISTGADFSGGITLTTDLEAYSTLELSLFDFSTQNTLLGEAYTHSPFGNPWQLPRLIFTHVLGPESGIQLATGRLSFSDEIALFPWSEGDPNLRSSQDVDDYDLILRVPIGLLPVSPSSNDPPINFGPLQQVVSLNDDVGRIDTGPAELMVPHVSSRGPVAPVGNEAVAAWWALTDPDVGTSGPMDGVFTRQRVYGNDVMATAPWPDWGAATELSDPGEQHNSWPFMASFPDGTVVAMWWSTAVEADLFDASLFATTPRKYWSSTWTPGQGWSTADDVTPPGAATSHALITKIDGIVIGPPNNRINRIVLFGWTPTGPIGRIHNPVTQAWSMPSPAPGTFDIPRRPDTTDYVVGRYGKLRTPQDRTTPRATNIGSSEYFVWWINDTGTTGEILVTRFDSASGTWDPVVDLSSVANIDPNDPRKSSLSISSDDNGFVTLVWREGDTVTGESDVFSLRANILLSNGAAELLSATRVEVSLPGYGNTFPGISNTHPSGAMMVFWASGIPRPGTLRPTVFLGSSVVRFQ